MENEISASQLAIPLLEMLLTLPASTSNTSKHDDNLESNQIKKYSRLCSSCHQRRVLATFAARAGQTPSSRRRAGEVNVVEPNYIRSFLKGP